MSFTTCSASFLENPFLRPESHVTFTTLLHIMFLSNTAYIIDYQQEPSHQHACCNFSDSQSHRLNFVQLNGKYKHLIPRKLIWLCWHACPLKFLPDVFFLNQKILVAIDTQSSNLVQVCEGSKLEQPMMFCF